MVFLFSLLVVYMISDLTKILLDSLKNIKNGKAFKIKKKFKINGYLFEGKKGGKKRLGEIYICALCSYMQ